MESIARLMKEMPENYEEKCYETKAIQRKRGIDDPNNLMMLALFHVLNGCSLTEISVIAEVGKLGKVSDVAFMKRFEHCNAWFEWISGEIALTGQAEYKVPQWLLGYRTLGFDASDVSEKGRSGRIYRLHYSLDIFNMRTHQYAITGNKTGESLCNFAMQENDLCIADRAYGTLRGIQHCLAANANFILRLRTNCFCVYDQDDKKVSLLEAVKAIGAGEFLDMRVFAHGEKGTRIPLRICAMRKPQEAVERTRKRLASKSKQTQVAVTPEAKLFNEYIVLVTALPESIAAEQVLQAYRLRWQVEIYFKRLKSILDFGELPKRRPDSVFAWLNGKLMVALLIEKIISGNDFSPRGQCEKECLA